MNDNEKLEAFLKTQTHMVIAVTCDDGTPWSVPVKVQNYNGRDFEWDSKVDTFHSIALEQHSRISITMFSRDTDPFGQFGFYAVGNAVKLIDKDHGVARYAFSVERAWINDHTFVKREVEI